jgi:hypothetical protein
MSKFVLNFHSNFPLWRKKEYNSVQAVEKKYSITATAYVADIS